MTRKLSVLLGAVLFLGTAAPAAGAITRVWLSHRTNVPSKLVVNWEAAQPGNSVVQFAAGQMPARTVTRPVIY